VLRNVDQDADVKVKASEPASSNLDTASAVKRPKKWERTRRRTW
jgi:hypothetical protein